MPPFAGLPSRLTLHRDDCLEPQPRRIGDPRTSTDRRRCGKGSSAIVRIPWFGEFRPLILRLVVSEVSLLRQCRIWPCRIATAGGAVRAPEWSSASDAVRAAAAGDDVPAVVPLRCGCVCSRVVVSANRRLRLERDRERAHAKVAILVRSLPRETPATAAELSVAGAVNLRFHRPLLNPQSLLRGTGRVTAGGIALSVALFLFCCSPSIGTALATRSAMAVNPSSSSLVWSAAFSDAADFGRPRGFCTSA
jgi:hypothetical protein